MIFSRSLSISRGIRADLPNLHMVARLLARGIFTYWLPPALLLLPVAPALALTLLADVPAGAPQGDALGVLRADSEAPPDPWQGAAAEWPATAEQAPSLSDAALGRLGGSPTSSWMPAVMRVGVASSALSVPPVWTLFVTLAVGLGVFMVGSKLGPLVPSAAVPLIVCAVYVVISVAIDLSIAVQKQPGYAFNPVCAVLVTEAVKLCLSTAVYAVSMLGGDVKAVPAEASFSDIWCMAVPAFIYSVNNILVYHAIQQNSMGEFGIFRDTIIIWTACLWRCVFRVPLGSTRLVGIIVVFSGLVFNKVFSTFFAGAFSWRFMWIVAMTICNAVGSVANEYALKRNGGLDINVQNIALYGFCTLFTALILLVTDPHRYSSSLFTGFSSNTWLTVGLQSIVGLLIARLLKYADAVMKSIGTCLRGPVVVLVAPLFTHVPATPVSCVSAVIVASGCFMYLTQGPMKTAAAKA